MSQLPTIRSIMQPLQPSYPPHISFDTSHRQTMFQSRTSYPSPVQGSKLPSIRQTGLLDSPMSKHASPPAPRQMPTPPGSSEFGPPLHSFSKPDMDEGYDSSEDSEHHHEPLFYPPTQQAHHHALPFPHDSRMPSLEALIKMHIDKRDNRPFDERRISPPTVRDYRAMSHFYYETEALRRHSFESPRQIVGQKRHVAEWASPYSAHSVPLVREASSSTVEDYDPDFTPIQSRKRRSVGPGRRRADVDLHEQQRRGHARTTSKSSAKGAAVAKNARAQKSKAQKSDRFEDYPDFSPPASTMLNAMEHAKNVKDWHGSSINVYEDPDREQLSEPELIVAQHLHLPCSKYLCVKRQIFEELVKWLREEQEKKTPNWNKTTAQGAVNCDVTKASELFIFYQRVGWFNRDLFKKWTDQPRGSVHYSSQGMAA